MDANGWKDKGNISFQKGKYEEALKHYSQGLKLEPKNHVLYSNRSVAYFNLGNYEKALEDADHGIESNPDWPKNYLRKAEALFHLKRLGEVFNAVGEGKKRVQSGSPEEKQLDDILDKSKEQLKLDAHYAKSIPHKMVSVRNVPKKGKGIFAEQNFAANEIIFTERPLLLLQKAENKKSVLACSNCLRFLGLFKEEFLNKRRLDLSPPMSDKCEYLVQEPIYCRKNCNEAYCSVECEEEAYNKYHSLLCTEGETSSPSVRFETHAYDTNYRFAFAARILAYTILHARSQGNSLEKGMDLFSRFCRSSWNKIDHYDASAKKFAHEEVDDFVGFKTQALYTSLDLLKRTPVFDSLFAILFTYDNYSQLLGMIDMNTTSVENLPLRDAREELMKKYGCSEDEVPFSSGIGLFTLHSCLNHSCKPNAEVVGGIKEITDSRIRVICLRTIKKGEEITISYVDFPHLKEVGERQKELKGCYLFDCGCAKCEQERK
eukprot:TRINITY_DN9071_c0_g1_i1.p1 TRINITY_DN9071_c0_g1~~TRINITY_DN9071_c0_g1_i1.p1  ORF type:complete len:489 (+),score=101.58 TRINITY_DN9071_c0_g1_i1:68-1534(+)